MMLDAKTMISNIRRGISSLSEEDKQKIRNALKAKMQSNIKDKKESMIDDKTTEDNVT